MGNQFIWRDRYNIGVEAIDKEHQKLFSIMNKLLASDRKQADRQWVYREGIKYFKGHAMKHFAEEEVYMASIDYMDFEIHRRIHDNFRKRTLPALEKELERSNYSDEAVDHFMGVCAGWLIGHTLTEDRAITRRSVSRWAELLPEEEQDGMTNTIMRLMNNMFNLEPKLISSHYSGEKFGKGIYYRLIYANENQERVEIIMAFEEKLLLNTIGSIIGGADKSVNVLMVNATRYTAQQFANCIREQFPSVGLYELKEENLMTYDQCKMEFEREHPKCSLLFDTGEGYFAYSVFAPTQTKSSRLLSLTADNAMNAIGKYLVEGKESKKGKILVVDDSGVARQAMKELLEKDYQVTLAQSGFSAIRSITLDRPDLVLLDYEMPVCDGRQVLEMIRSEEDIADIPVIFLTGRVDRDSVGKVMALKPKGYLSKTLKPAEIKKSVDDYFSRIVAG